VISSTGRPQILHDTLLSVQKLEPAPSEIVVSVAAVSDILNVSAKLPRVRCALSPLRGLAAQRNLALRALDVIPDIVVFLDDDVELSPCHLRAYIDCFESDASVVIASGNNLMSGIRDIDRREARLAMSCEAPVVTGLGDYYADCRALHGCSMAMRGTLVNQVWFDENLPLWSYLGGYDLALIGRLFGRCVKVPSAHYVHLQPSTSWMSPHLRGYSEVVNPFYIARKHRLGIPPRMLMECLQRTVQSIGLSRKEGIGRFVGNVRGWKDVIQRRSDPRKILLMQ
jgi:GT2 family glycosyltransferase